MKNKIKIVALASIVVACGAAQNESTENDNSTVKIDSSEILDETLQGGFHYDEDFEAFKKAVFEKNKEDVTFFLEGEELEVDNVIQTLNEDWVKEQLEKAKYADLRESEFNGNPAVELDIYIEGTDEEGNIYESGVSLFFDEGMNGLKLIYILYAG